MGRKSTKKIKQGDYYHLYFTQDIDPVVLEYLNSFENRNRIILQLITERVKEIILEPVQVTKFNQTPPQVPEIKKEQAKPLKQNKKFKPEDVYKWEGDIPDCYKDDF